MPKIILILAALHLSDFLVFIVHDYDDEHDDKKSQYVLPKAW